MSKESIRLYLTYQEGIVTAYIESDEGLQEYQRSFKAAGDYDPHDYCMSVAETIERELNKPVRWSMVIKEGSDSATKRTADDSSMAVTEEGGDAEEEIADNSNNLRSDESVLGDVFARVAHLNPDDRYPRLGNFTEVSLRSVAQIDCFKRMPKERVVCVDVETTGIRPIYDEVLQVSICDGTGSLLLNSYVRPARRKRWPNAQEINHITWDMVKDAPTIVDLSSSIESILDSADLIIGYNMKFDLEFLELGRVNIDKSWYLWDIMSDCSVMMGKWSNYYGNYSYVKLLKAAERYNIEYNAHDAGEDARATVKVYYAMLDDIEYIEEVKKLEAIDADKRKQLILNLKEEEKRLREAEEKRLREAEEKRLREAEEKRLREERERNTTRTIRGCLIAVIIILYLMFFSCTSQCTGSRGYRSYKSSYVISTPVL